MSAEQCEELRPLLFSIAYRILGSVSEAEDAVQETWLRYHASTTPPISLKSFLSAVVTRVAIDVLRSARVRRESYVDYWLPEPLLTDDESEAYPRPEHAAELADSLSMAALMLLERLTPEQRAVFVLHEVFSFPFGEVADVIGKSEAACRQLASRARRVMEDGRPRFDVDRREREGLAARFFDAMTAGDVDALRQQLAADVEAYGDGGGKAPQCMRVIVGRENVARMFAGLSRRFAGSGLQVEPHQVNGQPGAVLRNPEGRVINVLALDVVDRRIQVVRSIINPDKLRHIGPVADAWALMHRTPPDPRRYARANPTAAREPGADETA